MRQSALWRVAGWRRSLFALGLCGLAITASVPLAHAQSATTEAQKLSLRVPMRDGVKLSTDVYLPGGGGPFPVVLIRTPYGKSMGAALSVSAGQHGYAIVVQDTRGRGQSEGANLPFIGDGWWGVEDGYDTTDWLARQPWCNGKIGTWGMSALGITQLGLAGTGTPHLNCQFITFAAPGMYQYAGFPGGVFKKAMIEDWLRGTKHDPEALKIWTAHPDYDSYWRDHDLTQRWSVVNAPAIHIGGWFDIFSQGTIEDFLGYQTKGGPNARGKQKLILGPWVHGAGPSGRAGELVFPQNAQRPPGNLLDIWAWYDYNLKGIDNGIEKTPAVAYYVMGDVDDKNAPGNVWRTSEQWPPVGMKPMPYYFRADHGLAAAHPTSGESLSYDYDPKNPVPTLGGPELTIPAGSYDQRKIESRPDVLSFTTDALTTPLEVTGRVRVHLYAASNAPDTDFTAKLCDVYPDGRSMNICEGILRARFREGFTKEVKMQPGKVYAFDIDLWSTSIIFNKGHRLRVLVTSSSSPGYDPNPNTGAPFRADDRTQVAHNTIYCDAAHPSHILLPVPVGKQEAKR